MHIRFWRIFYQEKAGGRRWTLSQYSRVPTAQWYSHYLSRSPWGTVSPWHSRGQWARRKWWGWNSFSATLLTSCSCSIINVLHAWLFTLKLKNSCRSMGFHEERLGLSFQRIVISFSVSRFRQFCRWKKIAVRVKDYIFKGWVCWSDFHFGMIGSVWHTLRITGWICIVCCFLISNWKGGGGSSRRWNR